jgi:hypothetical protein
VQQRGRRFAARVEVDEIEPLRAAAQELQRVSAGRGGHGGRSSSGSTTTSSSSSSSSSSRRRRQQSVRLQVHPQLLRGRRIPVVRQHGRACGQGALQRPADRADAAAGGGIAAVPPAEVPGGGHEPAHEQQRGIALERLQRTEEHGAAVRHHGGSFAVRALCAHPRGAHPLWKPALHGRSACGAAQRFASLRFAPRSPPLLPQ